MIELVVGEELSEDVIGLVEVKVTVGAGFGSIEAVGVIGLAFVGVGQVFIGLCDFSKLLNSLVAVVRVLIGMPPYG